MKTCVSDLEIKMTDEKDSELLSMLLDLQDIVERIRNWHSRETGPCGLVGTDCAECRLDWPCDTRRMIDGTYKD